MTEHTAQALDFPAPLDRSRVTLALCHALGGVCAALSDPRPLAQRVQALTVSLGDAARAAQVLATLDGTPSAAQALAHLQAHAEPLGVEFYPPALLGQFQGEAERRAGLTPDPMTGGEA